MNKAEIVLLSFLVFLFLYGNLFSIPSKTSTPMDMVKNIHWLGQATVKIEAGEKVIYIDPYQIKNKDKADIILVTHGHGDHLSLSDIEKVRSEKTTFVAPQDCAAEIKKKFKNPVVTLKPGQSRNIHNILIEAVPAYNVVKTNFHPKSNQWVGYILLLNGIRIYHAGDTERIPEMKTFTCDIALLPLGQTYTMNSVQEAADAALDVKAKIAIPIHYGLYEGKKEDANQFKKLLKDKIKVLIVTKE
jgi:L-ascorbate metabolism protein UlaG (beta-lactamase superfamily)